MEILIKKAPDLEQWKSHFKEINLEWLRSYFQVTPADLDQLDNPERILDGGGMILFLIVDDKVAGTLALVAEPDGTMELAKMGVLPPYRGKGLGRLLILEAVEQARKTGAKGLHLDTVEVLRPAIALYQSVGFERAGESVVHPLFGRTTFRMEMKGF